MTCWVNEGGGVCGSVDASNDHLDGFDVRYGMFGNFGSDGSDTDFSDDFDNEVEEWIHQEQLGDIRCASPRITFLMKDMALDRPDSITCLEDAVSMASTERSQTRKRKKSCVPEAWIHVSC